MGLLEIASKLLYDSSDEQIRIQCSKILSYLFVLRQGSILGLTNTGVTTPMDSALLCAQIAVKDPSSEVRKGCVAALLSIVNNREGAEDIAVRTDILECCIKGMETTPSFITVLRALTCTGTGMAPLSIPTTVPSITSTRTVTTSYKVPNTLTNVMSTLFDLGIMPVVTNGFKNEYTNVYQITQQQNSEYLTDYLRTLRALVSENTDNAKLSAIKEDILPIILSLLSPTHSLEIRHLAIDICSFLTLYIQGKRAILGTGPNHYVAPFVACLHDKDGLLSASAVTCVRHLSEVADGRGAFLHALLHDHSLVLRVFGGSVADELLHLVQEKSSSQGDRAQALEVLLLMCESVEKGGLGITGIEAIVDAINGGITILVDVAVATYSTDTLTVRDRQGLLLTPRMLEVAVSILRTLAKTNQSFDDIIRHRYETINIPCRILDD